MKSASEIENIVVDFIKNDQLAESVEELTVDSNLFAEGYLDSVAIMRLIARLEKLLETKIPPKDLVPRNFMTIQAMCDYLTRTETS